MDFELTKCSGAFKNDRNSVWIKRNSKDFNCSTANRNKENYGIIKESISVQQKHPLNYGYGSMTTFETKPSHSNNYNNISNYAQNQSLGFSTEDNSINFGMLDSTNTSCSSLPHKKRKLMSDFSTKTNKSYDKSPLIEEFLHDASNNDVSSEPVNIQQNYGCSYYYVEGDLDTQYKNSDTPNHPNIHNYRNADLDKHDTNPASNETRDLTNILRSTCNNVAQKVPKTLNLTDYNQRKIVPHQPIQDTTAPIIEKVLSPVSLTRHKADGHDIEDKVLSPNLTSLFNVEKTNQSKETSPQNSDSSVFKMPSSVHGNNTVPSRSILKYSTSKSCLKYRKACAISGLAFSAIMIMTFSVLYWNYHEAMHRRMTNKKDGPILDHWGKVSRF